MQAEFKGATELAKDLDHKRELASEIGIQISGSCPVYTDSVSLIAVVKNAGPSPKNKQFNRDINYLKECVESMKIELRFIGTDDNAADLLTKAKGPGPHHKLTRKLLGPDPIVEELD